ncbi:MAG TPA: hypothetical protein VHX61_02340 [Rhizomicrobium sp.]|jgi:hypothetical protein|nr:hypothetical protein [Rhizomicrobium sp.]
MIGGAPFCYGSPAAPGETQLASSNYVTEFRFILFVARYGRASFAARAG